MIDQNESEYLTTKEACLYVRKTYSTLRRWVKDGKIPAPHNPTSKTRYYKKSDLDEFIRSNLDDTDRFWLTEKKQMEAKTARLKREVSDQQRFRRLTPKSQKVHRALVDTMTAYTQALALRVELISI